MAVETIITKETLLKEIDIELQMRNRVWAKVPGQNIFVNMEHQRRFNRLAYLRQIIGVMNDKEIAQYKERVEALAKARDSQGELFT